MNVEKINERVGALKFFLNPMISVVISTIQNINMSVCIFNVITVCSSTCLYVHKYINSNYASSTKKNTLITLTI